MAVSVKAVYRISGRKKVFLQTLPSELSWVISKCNDFSFWKYGKNFFQKACKDRNRIISPLRPLETFKSVISVQPAVFST